MTRLTNAFVIIGLIGIVVIATLAVFDIIAPDKRECPCEVKP